MNVYLLSIRKTTIVVVDLLYCIFPFEKLDDIEEIFMLLDAEGVGIVGWDSMVFFYMSLIKAGYATKPVDQKQFFLGF